MVAMWADEMAVSWVASWVDEKAVLRDELLVVM